MNNTPTVVHDAWRMRHRLRRVVRPSKCNSIHDEFSNLHNIMVGFVIVNASQTSCFWTNKVCRRVLLSLRSFLIDKSNFHTPRRALDRSTLPSPPSILVIVDMPRHTPMTHTWTRLCIRRISWTVCGSNTRALMMENERCAIRKTDQTCQNCHHTHWQHTGHLQKAVKNCVERCAGRTTSSTDYESFPYKQAGVVGDLATCQCAARLHRRCSTTHCSLLQLFREVGLWGVSLQRNWYECWTSTTCIARVIRRWRGLK